MSGRINHHYLEVNNVSFVSIANPSLKLLIFCLQKVKDYDYHSQTENIRMTNLISMNENNAEKRCRREHIFCDET